MSARLAASMDRRPRDGKEEKEEKGMALKCVDPQA
jgi:hypothetical protein